MADKTGISWTDATWSPVAGCTRVSEGCRHCYAERLAATRLRHTDKYAGLAQMTQAGPRWTKEVRCYESELLLPLRWKRARRIFVNSMSDTFHEDVPFEFIDRMFAVMALCPQHTFQVLTKRPDRAAQYFNEPTEIRSFPGNYAVPHSRREMIGMFLRGSGSSAFWRTKAENARQSEIGCRLQFTPQGWPLPNVWIGTSVEDQAAAEERIPHLIQIPAKVRFLSCEPLLENLRLPLVPVRLTRHVHSDFPLAGSAWMEAAQGSEHLASTNPHGALSIATENGLLGIRPNEFERLAPVLHWVIAGGESGPNARPMHPDWARSLRDQCAATGVPFHFKQWGEWVDIVNAPIDPPGTTIKDQVFAGSGYQNSHEWEGQSPRYSYKVGLKRACRLLDGVLHDAFPEVRN